jgi:hypothetical protein
VTVIAGGIFLAAIDRLMQEPEALGAPELGSVLD